MTTDIDARLEEVIEQSKFFKQTMVDGADGSRDIMTRIVVFRDNGAVAEIHHQPDRDVMLGLSEIATCGMSADAVIVAYETYLAKAAVNPLTNSNWEHDDMQYLAQSDPEKAKDAVTEAITVTAINRAGQITTVGLEYHYEGNTVIWGERHDYPHTDEIQSEGIVPDAFRKMMTHQTMKQLLESKKADWPPEIVEMMRDGDPEAVQYHQDKATVSNMQRVAHDLKFWVMVVLSAEPGSIRAAILERAAEENTSVTVLSRGDGSG